MSDWQPARLQRAHLAGDIRVREQILESLGITGPEMPTGKVVMVRETFSVNIPAFRAIGCDGEKFYSVNGYPGKCVCEHEILTD